MGLCKCIQKKVTNQFCFEHRVNVCEHCMVEEHPQCIIQSYLRWLNDSDYNPVCQLCQDYLVSADCVRLVCYDVFHQSCLNEWASKLPANTAPAGYICPVCSSGIFPASNLVSPVAVALKEVLSKWEWASAGLGMPIVKNIPENEKHSNYSTSPNFLPRTHSDNFKLDRGIPDGLETSINSSSTVGDSYKGENPFGSSQHRNVSVTNENKVRRDSDASSTVLIPEEEDHPSFDKYKRRPISEWLNQLIRTFRRPSPRHHQGIMGGSRSSAFIISIFVIVILIFIVSYFGGRVEDDDPFFDPLNNPNIRVED